MNAALQIDGVDVFIEGEAEPTIVMVHGWPDTCRLWDAQVESLKSRYRCVRFSLPGFEPGQPRRAVSLAEMTALIDAIVDAVSPARPVVLLLHDWGCFFGYEYAMRHPSRVARIVGVDIGDARSSSYARSLTTKARAMIVAYQVWLAAAWRIGGSLGDTMTRRMARAARAPADPGSVHAGMNYPYDIRWTRSHGSYRGALRFDPLCPMLFIYGTRKAFMFHSPAWAEALAAREGCRVLAFKTGHWVMAKEPQAFNDAVSGWLG
ncbi:MAG: alpha/beta fold hydrolase [Pseudomonadota bacterium]|nr:alpha/beta fold hydrolase [Pseudomonadota bacterium]